jgi:VanZ family protein
MGRRQILFGESGVFHLCAACGRCAHRKIVAARRRAFCGLGFRSEIVFSMSGVDDAAAQRGRFFHVAAIVWSVCIVTLCLWPHPRLPEAHTVEHFDKVVHASVFVLQAFLLRGAGFKITWAIVAGAALAIVTELLQAGIPSLGRSGDVLDAIADFMGLAAGLLLFRAFNTFRVWSADRALRRLSETRRSS